jgi:hypothetical protein
MESTVASIDNAKENPLLRAAVANLIHLEGQI